jgi:hypothetical protein
VPTVFFFICEVFVEGHQIGKQADATLWRPVPRVILNRIQGRVLAVRRQHMSCLRTNGPAGFIEIGFVVVLAPSKRFLLDFSSRDNRDGFGNSESGLKSRDVHVGRVAQLVRAPASHARTSLHLQTFLLKT